MFSLADKRGKGRRKFDLDTVRDYLYETGGKPAIVARMLNCSSTTLYDWIHVDHPELIEEIEKARQYAGYARVDVAEYCVERLVDKVDEDPKSAFNAAKLALTANKEGARRGWGSNIIEQDTSDTAAKIGFVEAQKNV